MTLSPTIWKVDDVRKLADRVKGIILQELITIEYTSAGNSFRKQFAMPLNDILIACDTYLSLYGDPSELSPDATNTRTFIVN